MNVVLSWVVSKILWFYKNLLGEITQEFNCIEDKYFNIH